MSTEKKKKLTKQEMIDKLRQLSEKDLQAITGGFAAQSAKDGTGSVGCDWLSWY